MNIRIALCLVAGLALMPQAAYATKKITSPYVEKDTLKLEWKGGLTQDDEQDSKDGAWAQKFGAEYGVTNRIALKAEATIENEGNDDNTDATAMAVETKIQLTEKGTYWLDAGVKAQYEFNLDEGPDSIELKLLLAKETGPFTHRANMSLSREAGDNSSDDTEAGLAWGSRYRYTTEFEPGFELHSSFGALDHTGAFDDQDHRLGPVVYGKLGQHFKYDVGYLFGISDHAPDGTLKVVLEYSFPLK